MLLLRRVPACAAVVFLAGCGADTNVSTYDVPKEPVPTAAGKPEKIDPPAAGAPARMLGVIVPVDATHSRFVKLVAAPGAIAAVEAEFRTFAKSLRVGAGKDNPLEYELPAGWRTVPLRQGQMRQATIQAGAPGKVVELSLSNVFGGDVLANVNRWRKEVSLPELTEANLAGSVEALTLATGPATLVDLTGTAAGGGMGGMMPPPAPK